jgi:hypothetical protein
MDRDIFIAHAPEDEALAQSLSRALADYGIAALERPRGQVIALVSARGLGSPVLGQRIAESLERRAKVVPLVLTPIAGDSLERFFRVEPASVEVEDPTELPRAIPALLAAIAPVSPLRVLAATYCPSDQVIDHRAGARTVLASLGPLEEATELSVATFADEAELLGVITKRAPHLVYLDGAGELAETVRKAGVIWCASVSALGGMVPPPPSAFAGRTRELLEVERALGRARYVSIVGPAGEGKTTLAVEVGRWMVETRRFVRAAFVAFEHASAGDERRTLELVDQALREQPAIVVLDAFERVQASSKAIRDLIERPGRTHAETRFLLTTRTLPPKPFAEQVVALGPSSDVSGLALGHARLDAVIRRTGAAADAVHGVLEALAPKYEDERARAQAASVELALLGLPDGMREKLAPLAIFNEGGDLAAIAAVLESDVATAESIARALERVGLAERKERVFVRFDRGLLAHLFTELSPETKKLEDARERWAQAISQGVMFLYRLKNTNPRDASALFQLQAPSFGAMLQFIEPRWEREDFVEIAATVDTLRRTLR